MDTLQYGSFQGLWLSWIHFSTVHSRTLALMHTLHYDSVEDFALHGHITPRFNKDFASHGYIKAGQALRVPI